MSPSQSRKSRHRARRPPTGHGRPRSDIQPSSQIGPTVHHVRADPQPIHQPLHRRPTCRGGSIPITNLSRGSQIAIAPAARPSFPQARFPPLEAFGRRPRARRPPSWGGIRNPSQKRPVGISRCNLRFYPKADPTRRLGHVEKCHKATSTRPHYPPDAREAALQRQDPRRRIVPLARGAKQTALPHARRCTRIRRAQGKPECAQARPPVQRGSHHRARADSGLVG
jgi:hypothetical protein